MFSFPPPSLSSDYGTTNTPAARGWVMGDVWYTKKKAGSTLNSKKAVGSQGGGDGYGRLNLSSWTESRFHISSTVY